MNASTSTFYAHTFDHPQDEFSGQLGGSEPDLPDTWNFSIDVARRWEEAFYASSTPATRKVALRSSMTMSPDPGGVFSVLSKLVRAGLGGTEGSGRQFVSWIHDRDYCRATGFVLAHPRNLRPGQLHRAQSPAQPRLPARPAPCLGRPLRPARHRVDARSRSHLHAH